MPERFLPASSPATMRPNVVVAGSCNASVCFLSTCRGNPAQPDTIRIAAASSGLRSPDRRAAPRNLFRPGGTACAPGQDLGIGPSYQAHFAAMLRQRRIRSFVLRAGRTTPAQQRALAQLWPAYGIEMSGAALNLDAIFGRCAPRCLEIGFGAGEVIG